jgi:hypothetical protein
VRQVFGIRVQDCGELAMMFEQRNALFGDPIDGRPCAKDAATDADVTRLNEPPNAPIETAPRTIRTAKLHQLKQLVMTDEPRIADLTQQGDVTLRIDDQTSFGVAHNE